jgi:hypothetical protein
MLTPTKQVEIATRGMDAVFGYTQAAINATFEANARVLAVWSQLAQTVLPFAVWSDLMQTSQQTWFKGAPSPFAWWAWSPQSAVPATWPWAYGMIASGIPGSVAWPMAEANVALMDAAKKTAEAAAPVTFPSYQSSGGFASAQVWMGTPLLKSIMAVGPATALFWPLLERAA